ncbi:hypothetical protein [Chitinophaga sancti]|uniref:Uncharacterized protein n=1 Tax=Chitinophaga sancti TaxID=1004 RepID=A0A1K1R0M7_9BACT|nr:hypothetical protein [Chitinophaga sancti]WQD62111.1 hypothetical protein U0033_29920 [Chitinophaga sancti]WQG92320.1 hypothetical protein SR876_12465 [Chitinophaga sancti]SFW65126.1 hypothetical protein SAMN05661012_03250 [Chitinophaga sancti]
MRNNIEILLFNFDETALVAVNSVYNEFLISIKNVDRLKDENTVQLWVRKYMDRLKQRLDSKALEYISNNRNIPTPDWFQKRMLYMIQLHLQEFSQMVRYA